jgi:hypothetical protein
VRWFKGLRYPHSGKIYEFQMSRWGGFRLRGLQYPAWRCGKILGVSSIQMLRFRGPLRGPSVSGRGEVFMGPHAVRPFGFFMAHKIRFVYAGNPEAFIQPALLHSM